MRRLTKANITDWKLETARLYCEQINNDSSSKEASNFAEACYDNISGNIDMESPQDCIDSEIDAMRSCI
jgi:hypothetical protein